jgi:Xaa-Pro dipeptidase
VGPERKEARLAGYIDVERARHLMAARKLDALLLCTPENFFYGTGYASMIFELYRRAPIAMALLPAGKDVDPAVIVPDLDADGVRKASGMKDVQGYPLWAERYTLEADGNDAGALASLMGRGPAEEGSELPEQYDRTAMCGLLAAILKDRGLDRARIGLEMDFVDVNTYSLLCQANEDVDFVDSTALMDELRWVKNAAEIDWLRKACALTEAGIVAGAGEISRGASEGSIRQALSRGVWRAAGERGLTDALDSVGGQIEVGGPEGSTAASVVEAEGAIIKFDVQVRLSHYHSDVSRAFVYGSALPGQRRIYEVLQEAHARARDTLRPGTPICDVYDVALRTVRDAGFAFYRRGHFGHSVGLDPKIEEPPFISATETRPLVPGMVLAVETPFYLIGLGAFQLEDMCLITDRGCEILSELPRELREVPLTSGQL